METLFRKLQRLDAGMPSLGGARESSGVRWEATAGSLEQGEAGCESRENLEVHWEGAVREWAEGKHSTLLADTCAEAMRQQAHLLDLQYLRERTTAILARETMLGTPLIPEVWALLPFARECMADILLEDEARYRGADSATSDWLSGPFRGRRNRPARHHQFLVQAFGIESHLALAASVRFHRMPGWSRHAFQALIVDALGVEDCLAMGLGPKPRLLLEVRRCLKALLFLEDLWPEIQIPGRPKEAHPYEF